MEAGTVSLIGDPVMICKDQMSPNREGDCISVLVDAIQIVQPPTSPEGSLANCLPAPCSPVSLPAAYVFGSDFSDV